MTIENWLMIALIISSTIATLLAPVLALFVRSRISQPTPIPDPNQPKNRTHRIGGWLRRFLQSRRFIILPLCGIPPNIYILLKELRSTAPVTRGTVLLIVTAALGIVWNFLTINDLLAQQSISRMLTIADNQAEIATKQIKTMAKQNNNMDMIIGRIEDIERKMNAQPELKDGKLTRLLAAIKKML